MTTEPTNGARAGANGAPDLMQLLPLALGFLSSAEDTAQLAALRDKLRTWARQDPLDAVLATVLGGGIAFYLAEKSTNATMTNPWDGIAFVVETMSMGAASERKPTTATGHALAAFVQTFGPALAFSAFTATGEETRTAAAAQQATQLAILERLDRIVQLLETTA